MKSHFWRKNVIILSLCSNGDIDVRTFPENCKPLVVDRFYCMALFLSQTQRHMINNKSSTKMNPQAGSRPLRFPFYHLTLRLSGKMQCTQMDKPLDVIKLRNDVY